MVDKILNDLAKISMENNYYHIIEYFCENKLNDGIVIDDKYSLLSKASYRANIPVIQLLLESKSDPNKKDIACHVPLYYTKDENVIKLLCEYGAKEIKEKSEKYYEDEIVDKIMQNDEKINIYQINKSKLDDPVYAFICAQLKKIIGTLNSHGFRVVGSFHTDVNHIFHDQILGDTGMTLLELACKHDFRDLIGLLIHFGANPYATFYDEKSNEDYYLYDRLRDRYSECVIKYIEGIDNTWDTLLIEIEMRLLSGESLDVTYDNDNMPLLLATIHHNRLELTKFLLLNGANPNIRDSEGWDIKILAQINNL